MSIPPLRLVLLLLFLLFSLFACLSRLPLAAGQMASITHRSIPSAASESPVSWSHSPEAHHSLSAPLDKTQVYWAYGGSTVLTSHLIRLTPSTQDRRGWLWNEYPLESADWEVEVVLEISSRPHFGGDGMCLWALAGHQDPAFSQRADALDGPVFGMKADFAGLAVCIDVYDNDNKRNNPTVFVLEQERGSSTTSWHHDTDYEEDMVTSTPPSSDPSTQAHKCMADIRNTGRDSRLLVRLQHGVLHVYADSTGNGDYRFCLAVTVKGSYRDHHLAFSAATGGVADNYDIKEVTTRYLKEDDKEFDDARLGKLRAGSGGGWTARLGTLYWLLLNAASLAVIAVVGLQLFTYHSLVQSRIDLVQICQQINAFTLPHYAGHALVTVMLLLAGSWWLLLLNLPLLAWKVYEFARKSWLFSPASVGPVKGHAKGRVSVYWKLGGMLAFYSAMQIAYIVAIFRR
jgi:hypothetical protein